MSAIEDFSDLIPIIGIILEDFKKTSSSSISSSSSSSLSSSSPLLSLGGGGRGGVSAEDDDNLQEYEVNGYKAPVDTDRASTRSGARSSLSEEASFVISRLANLHEWYEDADNVPLMKNIRQRVMDQVRFEIL